MEKTMKTNIVGLSLFLMILGFFYCGGRNPQDKVTKAYEMIIGSWTDGGDVMEQGVNTYTFEKDRKFRFEFTIGNSNNVETGTYMITEKGNELLLEFHTTWEASKYGGASDIDRKEKPVLLVFPDSDTLKLGETVYKRGY
jgi:hypothetical protein